MRYYFFDRSKCVKFPSVFFLFVGLFSLLMGAVTLCVPTSAEGEVYDKVIRFHVIANSDSEQDQQLKLALRDAVIENYSEMFETADTKEMAYSILASELDDINEFAECFLRDNGFSYSCNTVIGEEYYNRTTYESFTMPEGMYTSLRIIIGEGKGKNWWCVLFPPMCTRAAMNNIADSEAEEAFIEAGFTGEQYRIITETDKPKYRVRFRLLELLFGK